MRPAIVAYLGCRISSTAVVKSFHSVDEGVWVQERVIDVDVAEINVQENSSVVFWRHVPLEGIVQRMKCVSGTFGMCKRACRSRGREQWLINRSAPSRLWRRLRRTGTDQRCEQTSRRGTEIMGLPRVGVQREQSEI